MSGVHTVLTIVIALFTIIAIACISVSTDTRWQKAERRAEAAYSIISALVAIAVIAWLIAGVYSWII